jgi:hypothetical protein
MKKNKIEINIEQIENINTRNFIQTEIAHCKKHKIRVEMVPAIPDSNGVESSGHFSDDPCLTVYTTDKIDEWLPIFVHESCHKDQFLEKTDIWNNRIGDSYDALEIFDMWIDRHVELKKHQMRPVLDNIIQVELDCERRAVEKIKKQNLDINISEYIQKANVYIWYYHAAAYERAYTKRISPIANSKVWTKMPLDFNNNYSKISSKMLKLFLKHCY